MADRHYVLKRRSPLIRDLFFPFYTIGQAGFFVCMLLAGLIWLQVIGFSPKAVVMAPAFMGGAAVLFTTAPAILSGSGVKRDLVEKALMRLGYRELSADKGWMAPVPLWMQWGNSGVKIAGADQDVVVSGPYTTLRVLLSSVRAYANG